MGDQSVSFAGADVPPRNVGSSRYMTERLRMHSAVGHAQAVALPTTSILALKRPRSMAQTLVQPARPADVPPRGPTDRGSGLVVSPHLTQTRMQRKRKAASEQGVSNPPSLETSETFLPQAAPADAATASARTRAPSLTTAQKERRNFLRRLRKKELKHAASIGDEAALKRLAQIKLRRQKETQSLTQEARKRKYENERDRLARLKKEL